MNHVVTLLVFVTLSNGVLFAQEEDSDAAPGKLFAKAYKDWKAIDAEIDDLIQAYRVADEKEKKKLAAMYEGLVERSKKMIPLLRKSALAAYKAAPNADEDVTQTLVGLVANDVRRDNYESAINLASVLLENQCKEPALHSFVGIAYYCTDDFESAETHLLVAKKKEALTSTAEACLKDLAKAKKLWAEEKEIRKRESNANDLPRVKLVTNKGEIVLELYENEAPQTVGNFVSLVESEFYNGLTFHRVLPSFMAQGGCPDGDGRGGPGYKIYCETENNGHRNHFRGTLSMAHAGKNTGGSQFFLTFKRTQHLDGNHTVFGRVIEGMGVLEKLQRRNPSISEKPDPDKIVKAVVIRKRNHEYAPTKVKPKKTPSTKMKSEESTKRAVKFVSSEPLLGEIRITGFNFAPRGWASCNGQLLSIKENQSLFSLLGTTYGGDGRTTFALPDLRGRVPVHSGEGSKIARATQGEKYGGENLAKADGDSKTQPFIGVNYVIALRGHFPSRIKASNTGRFAGEIRMFAATFPPAGWAFCDGQEMQIAENKSLFEAIGKAYGGNDTSFLLPDLRGRIPVHVGAGDGLVEVKRTEKGDGKKFDASDDPKTTVQSRACLGVRYILALDGVAANQTGLESFLGEIRIIGGDDVPKGWASCDGQLLPINQNDALFSLFGTIYGGDGRTTFGLPGLRGRTPIHAGKGPDLMEIKQGQKGGGAPVVAAVDEKKAVTTRPYLGVRYIVSLWGIYPSRN